MSKQNSKSPSDPPVWQIPGFFVVRPFSLRLRGHCHLRMFFGACLLIILWSNCFNTASLTVKAHVSSIVNIHQWVRRASPMLAANVSVLLKHGAVHLSTLEGWCMRWCSASAQGDDHSQSRQSQPPTPQQRLVNAFTVSWTIQPLQWFTGHWPFTDD